MRTDLSTAQILQSSNPSLARDFRKPIKNNFVLHQAMLTQSCAPGISMMSSAVLTAWRSKLLRAATAPPAIYERDNKRHSTAASKISGRATSTSAVETESFFSMEAKKQAFCSCLHLRFFYLALLICGAMASHVLAQPTAPSFDGSRRYPALGGTSVGAVAVATGDF